MTPPWGAAPLWCALTVRERGNLRRPWPVRLSVRRDALRTAPVLAGVSPNLDRAHQRVAAAHHGEVLLGVSARTLQRTTASGRLTVRMRDALALRRLSEESATPHPREEEADGLAQRLEHLEARVEALADEVRAALAARPSPVIGERTTVETPSVEESATGRPWRPYPQLITPEPEPGEELVYGEAMPTIVAWRAVRTEYREATRWLDKLDAERGACGRWRSCSSRTTS